MDRVYSSEYFTEMLLSYIFGASVVKYDILSNNRSSKQHAVIDCLFFVLLCFLVRMENQNARGKTLQSRVDNKTSKRCTAFILTWFTVVVGKFTHHCVNSMARQTGQMSLGGSLTGKRGMLFNDLR